MSNRLYEKFHCYAQISINDIWDFINEYFDFSIINVKIKFLTHVRFNCFCDNKQIIAHFLQNQINYNICFIEIFFRVGVEVLSRRF